MCEILTDRARGWTNIDSKFVRAWPARVKPIKRHPDNIFIRERCKMLHATCPLLFHFFFLSRLRIVTSSRILWDILRDSPVSTPENITAPHRTIYIYFARIVTQRWLQMARSLAKRSHLKWRVSSNMSVRRGGPNAIHRMINRAIGINRATFRDVEGPRELCR